MTHQHSPLSARSMRELTPEARKLIAESCEELKILDRRGDLREGRLVEVFSHAMGELSALAYSAETTRESAVLRSALAPLSTSLAWPDYRSEGRNNRELLHRALETLELADKLLLALS